MPCATRSSARWRRRSARPGAAARRAPWTAWWTACGAEASITRSRRAVTEAIDDHMPATHEDVRELKAELRAIVRRLDAIEERLPAKRKQAPKRKPAAKRKTSS